MKYKDFEAHVSETADAWLSRANRLAMSGLYPPIYLYYVEREGLRLAAEDVETPDPTWTLASPEPIRCGNTRETARRTIHAIARRLPIVSD